MTNLKVWAGPTLVFLCACAGPAFSLDAPLTLPLDAVSTGQADDSGVGEADAAQDAPQPAPGASTMLDAGADAAPEAQVSEASLAPPEASTPPPTSCDGLGDGPYVMALPAAVGGGHYPGYCLGGLEYLTLPHPEKNTSSFPLGGVATGKPLTTTFERLRFYPETLQVDATDLTFATSVGAVVVGGYSGGAVQSSLPYGVAASCTSSASGAASIDLAGTGLGLVSGQFGPGGYEGGCTVDASPDGLTTTLGGGGNCGWCGPKPFLTSLSVPALLQLRVGP
jgi:hypothetical protein